VLMSPVGGQEPLQNGWRSVIGWLIGLQIHRSGHLVN
jgi:hypothetical protein